MRAENLALARAFGLPLIWELGSHNDNRSVNAAAERAAIPMIATELGGGGGVDPEIADAAENGLLRCLGHLGIWGETPEPVQPRRVEITSVHHFSFWCLTARMKLENLTPEILADFSKSELIDVVMALVGQVV